MNTRHAALLAVLIAFTVLTSGVYAQPMPPNLKGQAVVTCFSGLDASGAVKNDYVAGLVNVHVPIGPGVNWPAPAYHGPSSTPWKASTLGQVFGITMDKRKNIYLTATSSYGYQFSNPYAYGAAGSGGVYQIDGTTGAINTGFITTTAYNTFAPTPASAIGTSTLPNGSSTVHPGLGNICYDRVHDKLFVTNFEDGIIYSINPLTAKIDGVYDPVIAANPGGTTNPAMVADNASSLGFVPRGDRVWGIAYNRIDNRVYYAVWMEDQSNNTASTYNIIRSIGLTATGAFKPASDDRFEIKLPNFLDPVNTSTVYTYSNPVSDIAFNTKGNILLAERSMYSDDGPSAHVSRVLEYTGASLSWSASPKVFYIGAGISYSNAAGGVDYGYGNYDTLSHTNLDCDSAVWITGDFLLNDFTFGGMLYGMQRSPAAGNTTATVASTGYFIDFNGVPGTQDKTQIGDVEVYRDTCGSADVVQGPCSLIRVIAKPIQSGVAGGPCCSNITLSNQTPNFWTNVTAEAITPGFVFGSATVPTGWSLTNTGTIANWMPPGGFVPVGATDSLILCITSYTAPPQKVEIVWHGVDGSICRDTLTFDCPPVQPPVPPCAIVKDSSLGCTQVSTTTGTAYQYCFTITNNSPFSQAPYFYPAANAMVWSSTPGVNVAPAMLNFPPLAFGATTAAQCVSLSGPGVKPGATVCIVIQLHGTANAQGDGFNWCCPPDTVCFTLPPCKDCCDGFRKVIEKPSFATAGTGITTFSSTITAGPMPIVKMTASIISADIKRFGNSKYCQSTGWLPASGEIVNPPATIATLPYIAVATPFATTPPAPFRDAAWGTVPSGVVISGVPVSLQMQFPAPPAPFFGCYDSLRFCVRLTFTDTSCRTCDTMICMQIKRVGSWIHYDPATDIHIGKIVMTALNKGTLTLTVPTLPADLSPEDGITITGVQMESAPGVHLSAFDGVPTPNYVGTKQISLANGKQLTISLDFDNYASLSAFDNTLTYQYSPANDAKTILRASEQVFARVPGGTSGDMFAKDDSTPRPTNVRTYALYFANRNKAGIPVSSASLTVGSGMRILATGPFEDSATVSYSAMNGAIDGKPHLFAMGSPWFVDGPECKVAFGAIVRPIYLTVAGDTGKIITIRYQTKDSAGNILTTDSVNVSDPLSIVHKGDPSGSTNSAYLYPLYPNPTTGSSSVQFHLDVPSRVTLRVMNMMGVEVVKILENEYFNAGDHIFPIAATALASGTYSVVLQTAEGTESQSLRIMH